jgi:ribosomal protein S18 acetylase RimI-like enzyme
LHIDVLPEHQRRGFGRKLIAEFEAAVREKGAKGVHVVVAGENDKVVAFYEKCGFEVIEGGEVEGNVFLGKSL